MSWQEPYPAASPDPAAPDQEERTWGMFCHLAALLCYLGVPFGNIIGPLIIWLIKKDEMPFVEDQGKEVLNFQISVTIYFFASLVLLLALIGFVLLPLVIIFNLVVTFVAAVKAASGTAYRYPLCIRFLS